MKRAIGVVGAVAMLAGLSAHAQDHELDDRWYIVPSAGVAKLDSDRGADGNAWLAGLGFGRFLTPRFSVDLEFDRYAADLRHSPAGMSDEFELRSLGVAGRYYMGEIDRPTRPYALLATGLQEHDSWRDDGRDVFAAVGLGLEHRYSDRIAVRAQAAYRYDNDRDTLGRSSGFKDLLFNIGLKINFGERPRAPEPAPEPEPVRAPAPAPEPEPAPQPEPEREVFFEFDAAVTFEFDSARLLPQAQAELNEAAAQLNLHPEIRRIEVAGHTCDLGPEAYNQGLSQRRAQAVHDYLTANGVDASRLSVRGYGEDRPKVPNRSEENRRQNRRVELVVLERDN